MELRRWQDFNFYLLISVLVLIGFGSIMVYSTVIGALYTENPWTLDSSFVRHLIWVGIGLAAMLGLTLIDYQNWRLVARPLYIVTVAILAYTLVMGQIASGAQSWLFGASGQPSEPAKLLLILSLATWWASRDEQEHSWLSLFVSLILAGVPMLLVLVQPDMGTAMVIGVIWLVMAWGAGMTWKQVGVLLLIALPIAYIGWNYVLDDYQQARLIAHNMTAEEVAQIRDPEVRQAAQAVVYNVGASKVAIGNGGLLGQGFLHGTQNQRGFLPVAYTDFVFAVTAEEIGFVGAIAMLVFLCLVLWQAITVANRAKDTFGRLIAIGIFGMLLIHTFENIGMNLGLMPVTGIPLPFISYGGSFTVTTLAAMGLLLSIDLRRRPLVF